MLGRKIDADVLVQEYAVTALAARKAYVRSPMSDTTKFAQQERDRAYSELQRHFGKEKSEGIRLGVEAAIGFR